MTTNRIEAARLTDEEFDTAWARQDGFETPIHQGFRVADAATAKALAFQDAQRQALVEALRGLLEFAEAVMPWSHFETDRRVLAAQAALNAAEEEA